MPRFPFFGQAHYCADAPLAVDRRIRMSERQIGVIINGATGRMGTTQHMANLLAIAAEGGLALLNGDRLIPDLLMVGAM